MEVCPVSNELNQLECTRATGRKKTGDSGSIPSGMGAEIICLQETMLAQLEQRTWTSLRWGSGAAHVAIEASGRSAFC